MGGERCRGTRREAGWCSVTHAGLGSPCPANTPRTLPAAPATHPPLRLQRVLPALQRAPHRRLHLLQALAAGARPQQAAPKLPQLVPQLIQPLAALQGQATRAQLREPPPHRLAVRLQQQQRRHGCYWECVHQSISGAPAPEASPACIVRTGVAPPCDPLHATATPLTSTHTHTPSKPRPPCCRCPAADLRAWRRRWRHE